MFQYAYNLHLKPVFHEGVGLAAIMPDWRLLSTRGVDGMLTLLGGGGSRRVASPVMGGTWVASSDLVRFPIQCLPAQLRLLASKESPSAE